MRSTQSNSPPPKLERMDLALLGGVLAWGLWLLAPHLGHPGIHLWDEGMHQAAARGTYESFFYPHIYREHIYPVTLAEWWASEVWLHKPVAPFWFAALVMHVIGVTPLALRLASLLGQLASAVSIYLLARERAGRPFAAMSSLGFLALPFGWQLTQGLFFGDVTDCTVAAFTSSAMAFLLYAIRRDSLRWAFAAGAMIGLGFLCKTVLALAPLGVAVSLFGLGVLGVCRGPRLRQLLLVFAGALVIAAPWNIYCAFRWPQAWQRHFAHAVGHLPARSGEDVGPWRLPVDGVFNGVNNAEFEPLAVVLPLLAGLWLLSRALRHRQTDVVAVALWLWVSWLVHSVASAKPPGILWHAMPAAWVALAVLFRDALSRPVLATATALALLARPIIEAWPLLGRVRAWVPTALVQTRTQAGLAEGVVLCALAALVAFIVWRVARRPLWIRVSCGVLVCSLTAWNLLVRLPRALKEQYPRFEAHMLTSHTREVGLVLGVATPKKSVVFQSLDSDPPESSEVQNGIFWSGRMHYRREPDLPKAREKGYHPYLLSPAAEPYAPVPHVPAHAWLRAYDLLAPREPPGLPPGAKRVDVALKNASLQGYAVGPLDGGHDKWAFFIRPQGVPETFEVTFVKEDGARDRRRVEPEASLRRRQRLARSPWFILPVIGPPREDVIALLVGPREHRIDLLRE